MSVLYGITVFVVLCASISIMYIVNTLKYNDDIEGFADVTSQTQRITSIKDIIIDPVDAEEVADTFYNSLNKRNMDIRKKTVKYYDVEDLTPSDREIIRDAYQYARTTFPLPLEGQFQVVITGNKTEGGFPHTHGNLVYIPLQKVKDNTEHTLRNTFLHEMSHIHQRQKRYLWEKLYNNLGFQRLPIDWPVPEDIHNKILANPDTWEHGKWEYKGQHAIMLINDDAKSIRDHTYQIIPVRDGVNMSVNQLKKSFGKITKQIDHPAEVTATALQKYIDTGDTGDLNVTSTIRCWLGECLAKQD